MFKNEKGFSLVQVLVGAGMMGGLTLAFMQFVKNTNDVQTNTQAKSEEMELRTSIRMILDDERYCRVSMAGNGVNGFPLTPVTFKKQTVDDINTEGLDISLYISNQSGDTRTLKKFNGANNPGTNDKSGIGKIKIKTLKLILNNPITPGPNYPDSPGHSDIGILRAVVSRKISTTTSRDSIIDFDVNVGMSTTSGTTKLLSCTRKKDDTQSSIPKQGFCTPSVAFDNNNTGVCPFVTGYTTTRISACIPGEFRTLTCCYVPTNDDSNGWCSDPVEGHSGCFTGCGSGSLDYAVDHINGLSTGKNDTHICCFIPRDNKVTKTFSSATVNSWDSYSGCNTHSNYSSLRINVVTAGKGNQTSCTYVPQ